MIKRTKIKNFKAFRDVDLSMSAINIFTGLNGMGKSTVLQMLMLFRQSRTKECREIDLNGDLVNIGTFQDAFCESAEDNSLELEVEWDDNKKINSSTKRQVSKNGSRTIAGIESGSWFDDVSLFSEDSFMYLNADRISPADNYSTDEDKINNNQLGNSGEYAPHYYHINKNKNIPIKNLAFDEDNDTFTLEEQLNNWMRVISPGVKIDTESKGDLVILKYIYITKEGITARFKAKNAGFGLTYVFSILVSLLSAKPGDIIIIENPESHIHPRGQSEIARLMAMAANNGVQIFCETHSDHILYGLRIAIKERDIDTEKVCVYYIERDDEEHFSLANKIIIDEYGRMDRSSKEYFLEYENHLDKLLG